MSVVTSGRNAALVLAAAAAAACSAGERTAEASGIPGGEEVAPSVHTESGVTVLVHSAGALQRAPQLVIDATPLFVIGGTGGDPQYDLTYVNNVVWLSDGRVITFSRIGNKVFVFGRDGKPERMIGRTGQGPGDWMNFGDPVLVATDTVLVVDFANRRLNWVTADGGIVRTAPYTVSGELRRMHRISGFLPSGELVMHSAGSSGGQQTDSLQRSLAAVVAANLSSSTLRTVATMPDVPGTMFETRYRGRIQTSWRPLRLGGWALVAVQDSMVVTATASSPALELRDPTGAVRSELRLGVPRRAVSAAMRDARIAEELERLRGPAGERLIDPAESQRIAREAPFADSLPYFSDLLRGSDGTLWVVHAIAPGDPGWTATAIRKNGAIVANLRVVGDSRPIAFADGRVILRSQDENGVVSLRAYRLR